MLNDLVLKAGDNDGFEGNAQSFRVVTKLAVRFEACDGLDLTRATLAACLKYPWMRDADHKDKSRKWSVYSTEKDDSDFARSGWDHEAKTAEAELMDWADDIAYSVHGLEDFHRCRVIPWHHILDESEREDLISRARTAWRDAPPDAGGRLRDAYKRLSQMLTAIVPEMIREPYEATRDQRRQIRLITSQLIGRYLTPIKLKSRERFNPAQPCIIVKDDELDEVRILKQITRDYVIANPALAAQQKGHERIIRGLFGDLMDDVGSGLPRYLPKKVAHIVNDDGITRARAVADCIASLTEAEAVALHGRLRGYSSGSVLDPIVR